MKVASKPLNSIKIPSFVRVEADERKATAAKSLNNLYVLALAGLLVLVAACGATAGIVIALTGDNCDVSPSSLLSSASAPSAPLNRSSLLAIIRGRTREVLDAEPCSPTFHFSKKLNAHPVYFNMSLANSLFGENWYVSAGETTNYFTNGRGSARRLIYPDATVSDSPPYNDFSNHFYDSTTTTGVLRNVINAIFVLGNGCYARSEAAGIGNNIILGRYYVSRSGLTQNGTACSNTTEYDWLDNLAWIGNYSFYAPGKAIVDSHEFADGESLEDCLPLPRGFSDIMV